jgi:hypothetical protein
MTAQPIKQEQAQGTTTPPTPPLPFGRMEVLNVDGASMPELNTAMRQTIFRPPKKENRLKEWARQKMTKWLIKEEYGKKRFRIIHRIKLAFVHPLLKYIQFKFGKYMVQNLDDIPANWWNNHLRMFYWCFADKGLEDMWKYMHWYQNPGHFKKQGYNTPQEFFDNYILKHSGYNLSHRHRQLLIKIWMTEVQEDTVDREWINMGVLHLAKECARHYGVAEEELKKIPEPGQFPIYLSTGPHSPNYFLRNRKDKVWYPPKPKEKGAGTAKNT